jgi:hydrogenase maturation protein HypF
LNPHEQAALAQRDTSVFSIRVRGLVQGVGFRPTVWRVARDLGLKGEVINDPDGVLIRVAGSEGEIQEFIAILKAKSPPLARLDSVTIARFDEASTFSGFSIGESVAGSMRTLVVPDAATCESCLAETFAPASRRFRFAFTTCTHCGPRLTIIERAPYDRGNTSMAAFPLCSACRREYEDPADRRFHAEPICCPVCGPKLQFVKADGQDACVDNPGDVIAAAAYLIRKGGIVAIKGLGGFHLACDATNAVVVERLRRRKRRFGKPLALMARDLEVVRRYARVDKVEAATLAGPAAPIVLLEAEGPERLPDAVAPGLSTLGFMLPSTPLHALLLSEFNRPLVMTSGNLSEEPQSIDDDDARTRLGKISDHFVVHDRRVVNRVDDSVVRVIAERPRSVRRARGYVPSPIPLPPGFEAAPHLLAMGGELKNTFCLVKDGQAILSQHQGDLENAETWADYEKNLTLFSDLFAHAPTAIAVDFHPDYLATKHGRVLAREQSLQLIEVQHHHAHVAACMAENGIDCDSPLVLGIVLDGLGLGADGEIWGGELLLADYREFRRLASLKPVAMPGGGQAVREPWRNLVAHLDAAFGSEAWLTELDGTPLADYLAAKRVSTLLAMICKNVNAPRASSCGRLFDAVAAALGLCADRVTYEGEAAIRLEALAEGASGNGVRNASAYHFAVERHAQTGILSLEPRPMWQALLCDLREQQDHRVMALRFQSGLAIALAQMAREVVQDIGRTSTGTIAVLSGGCFQNRRLTEDLVRLLRSDGFRILLHATVPANDGGLALGQAAIAAARLIGA